MSRVLSKRAKAKRAAARAGLLSGSGLFGSASLALGFLALLLATFGVFFIGVYIYVYFHPTHDYPRAEWSLSQLLGVSAAIFGSAALMGLLSAGAWWLTKKSTHAWKRLDASAPVLSSTLERLEPAETLVRGSEVPVSASSSLLRASAPGATREANAEQLLRAGQGTHSGG